MPQNVRQGEELHEGPLKQFLHQSQLISSPEAELHVSQFSNGFSNLTYLLKVEGKEFVLRRPPFGAIKRGHDMGREYKVLSNLHQAFPKSPQAYAFSDAPEILDCQFYVMEKVDGIILSTREAKKRAIPADQFPTIAESWLDTFVELHKVDYEKIGLGDLGRPEGYVARQVTNWGKQYLKAATMEIPEAEKLMAWMEAEQPTQYDYSLIHNDYKYDNIVFADESWESVRAVLDWEMCTLGDPLMDLGTSIAYWTMASDGPMLAKGLPSPTIMPGNPGRTEIVERYAEKSGRSIQHLVFYYVYGLFKLAVIAQQIYYRYHKGLTTDERFAQLDKACQMLCFMGWQAVQKKKIENLF
ncbi:MAG: phosphotransferase family protein [Bacteroidota bacterium]